MKLRKGSVSSVQAHEMPNPNSILSVGWSTLWGVAASLTTQHKGQSQTLVRFVCYDMSTHAFLRISSTHIDPQTSVLLVETSNTMHNTYIVIGKLKKILHSVLCVLCLGILQSTTIEHKWSGRECICMKLVGEGEWLEVMLV